jgi:ABC-type polysaccharide/polyol phosphate transport system ATPase subunit
MTDSNLLKSHEDESAIEISGVIKDYVIYRSPRERLIALINPALSSSKGVKKFRALDGISLTVRRGETMGIIGRNGAGKSTLLQVLCGTVKPTEGSVQINGRFAALLELGAGFSPDFSGRENVYMNASLLGLSRNEIDDRLDSIRAFADIGDFFDRPVKTYSSGMYVRLAFSVAIHTEPDVLIIDEALSVGDIRFQMKCLARIEALRARGATILFVSHSLEQIKRFCQTAIWMEGGRIKLHGEANFVADSFRDHEIGLDIEMEHVDTGSHPVQGSLPAFIESVSISPDFMAPFEPFTVDITYRIRDESVDGFLLGVAIKSPDGQHIFGPNTHLERVDIPGTKGSHRVSYHIPSMPLLSGTYRIDAGLFTEKGMVCLDYRSDVARVTIASPYFSEGLVYIPHEWKVHVD